MTYLKNAVVAALAGASLIVAASAASAQTVSPTGSVTASGQLTQSLLGSNATVCNVTFVGEALANGFRFDSYTGTRVSGGDLACQDSLVFPIFADAVSSTQLNVRSLTISTRLGDCTENDVPLTYSNAGSSVTFPPGTVIAPVCQFEGTLTVSPATTIN